MDKCIKLNDRDRTIVHANLAYWVATVSKTDLHSDLQYHLNINTMTANGIQTITLFYRNEEKRNLDCIDLLEWLEN